MKINNFNLSKNIYILSNINITNKFVQSNKNLKKQWSNCPELTLYLREKNIFEDM